MAEKQTLELDVVLNAEDSLQKLRNLKKLQKEVGAGSAEFNKIAAAIRDTGDALDSAKMGAEDLKGSLEAAPGPVGNLFKGLKQVELATKSWGLALKATGIGLLVGTIGLLVGAFAKTEGSMKALEPLFIQLEKTMGGLVAAFTPLLTMFAELAGKILPVVTKGIMMYYGAFVSLFTLIKEAGTGVAKIIQGIVTFDSSKASEGLEQLKGSWGKTTESFNEFQKNFEKGYAQQTATEKKNAEEAARIAKEKADKKAEADRKAKEAADKAFQDKLKRMEAEDKLDEANLKKLKEEALTLATTEQEKLDVEKKFAELAYQQRQKDLADKMALYKKDSLEYKNLQTEKVNLEADYINQLRGFTETQNKIVEEANKKKAEEDKKAAEEARGIRLTELQAQFEDLDAKNQLVEFDFEQDLQRLAEQRNILAEQERTELSNTELTEFQKAEIKKKYADSRKKLTDEEIATEKAAAQAKHDINMQYLDLAGQFGSLLQQIAGKNKGIAIAGIVVEQAASIAKIVANTAVGIAKLTPGLPFTAPSILATKISAGLGIASTIASAAKAISQINATPGGSAGGGAGSAASAGAPPSFNSPTAIAAPTVTAGVSGESPTTQIAQTIARAQQRPIVAQVVSSAVSSQQALDRRTNGAATFGGG